MSSSDTILHPKQLRFLACYSACGSLTRAARWAKIHRQTHYDWLRDSPAYPAAFEAAEERAMRTLEDEAVRRAHEGIRKAIRYKGKIVGYETEFSDTLLMFSLKGGKPEKYRDRQAIEHSGNIGIGKRLIGVDVDAI